MDRPHLGRNSLRQAFAAPARSTPADETSRRAICAAPRQRLCRQRWRTTSRAALSSVVQSDRRVAVAQILEQALRVRVARATARRCSRPGKRACAVCATAAAPASSACASTG